MMLRRKIEKILITFVLFVSISSTFTNVSIFVTAQDTSNSDQLLTYDKEIVNHDNSHEVRILSMSFYLSK